ncbi:MAG: hypothetical protein AB7S26_09260 [Sandaracinaceae bacterium]
MRTRACFAIVIFTALVAGCAEEIRPCPDGEGENAAGQCLPLGTLEGGMDAARGDAGTGDGGRDDAGPLCTPDCAADEYCVAGRCVDCRRNDDCMSAGASRCFEGACVPCEGPTDCSHLTDTHVCDTSEAPAQCVQCITRDDCGAPAPECVSQECVQCTPASQATTCTNAACDPATNTCSSYPLGMQAFCEPCVSDDDCLPSYLCVRTRWRSADLGGFCLPTASPDCPSGLHDMSVASLGGRSAPQTRTFCFPHTTCPALLDYLDGAPCGMAGQTCGLDMMDGVCFGGTCNYPCSINTDCYGASGSCAPSPTFHCET